MFLDSPAKGASSEGYWRFASEYALSRVLILFVRIDKSAESGDTGDSFFIVGYDWAGYSVRTLAGKGKILTVSSV